HNDLPWQLLKRFNNQLLLPESNLTVLNGTHTNIPKLLSGHVGGQFWSVYVPCDTQDKDAVKRTLEQIDVVHRMCELYPDTFVCVVDSAGIEQAFHDKKVASLIGVEGGHSIDSSLGVLRTFYRLGVRYMTLTHSCSTPCPALATVPVQGVGAGAVGAGCPRLCPAPCAHCALRASTQTVLQEMNRLGMIVDLAHVSVKTMKDALAFSRAPVIFSHSSAYSVCAHRRNVPDDVLRSVVRGARACRRARGRAAPGSAPLPSAGSCAGSPGHAGLRWRRMPTGLEDVSTYPALVAELLARGWSEAEVRAALAGNLLRVFKKVE
ncbi:DPEP1 Dipeptidase, partial [Nothoprocta ornata]|nr:DPEP1 Dipeptidase [Nothoprocta ornata]